MKGDCEENLTKARADLKELRAAVADYLFECDRATRKDARQRTAAALERLRMVAAQQEPPPSYDVLLTPLDSLGLSTRAENAFSHRNIVYVGQLAQCKREDVRRWQNVGIKTFEESAAMLANLGVSFGMVIEDWDHIGERRRPVVASDEEHERHEEHEQFAEAAR